MSEEIDDSIPKLSSRPMLVTNIYDISAIIGLKKRIDLESGLSYDKKQAELPPSEYVLAALQDILIHDYSIPCDIGLDKIDIIRNSMFLFDDMLMQMTEPKYDVRATLSIDRLSKYQEKLLNTPRIHVIIKDIVEAHKMRCNPDDSVNLFPFAEALAVGFRVMK